MQKEIKGENVTNKNLVTIKIKQRKDQETSLERKKTQKV